MTISNKKPTSGENGKGDYDESRLVDALAQHLSHYHKELSRIAREEELEAKRGLKEVIHSNLGSLTKTGTTG